MSEELILKSMLGFEVAEKAELNRRGVDIIDFGADPSGVLDSSAALLADIADGNDSVFIPKGTYLITQNIIIPENINLIFAQNARLLPAKNISITVSGSIVAGARDWIFDLSLGGSVKGKIKTKEVHPHWFGVKADGVNDDYFYLQESVNFLNQMGGGQLVVPRSDCHLKITKTVLIPSNVIVTGSGGKCSRIKQYNREQNVFEVVGDNVIIEKVMFEGDGGLSGLTFAKNNGVYASGVRNITIRDCVFTKFESAGIQFRDCYDILIDHNLFYGNYWSGTTSGTGNNSDIVLYSQTSNRGGRANITRNYCYSNNSQAIWVNPNGLDTEINITHNICVTMHDDGITEYSAFDADLKRRHSIEFSYNGNIDGESHINIHGNICKNNRWSGIYQNMNYQKKLGHFSIADNQIFNSALEKGIFDNTGKLSAGILLRSVGDGDIVSNNIISDIPNSPAIYLTMDFTPEGKTLLIGNTMTNCRYGVYLGNRADNVSVVHNIISDSKQNDIYLSLSDTITPKGSINIEHNKITRSNANYSAIWIDQKFNNTYPIIVRHNKIKGFDQRLSNMSNTGIYARRKNTIIEFNDVSTFYFGINYEEYVADNTRVTNDYITNHNFIEQCTVGIRINCITPTSTVLLEGNRFVNCTYKTKTFNGYNPCYIGRRFGDIYEISLDANPTCGTWNIGDRRITSTPVRGGYIGGVCIAGGSQVGTWSNYGKIE